MFLFNILYRPSIFQYYKLDLKLKNIISVKEYCLFTDLNPQLEFIQLIFLIKLCVQMLLPSF